ncbi:class I SAM-dependent methyltransferase [Archangium minus]|uniref:S-adenosyl-L-methionine-dependent methyltransferase n=2 Tax=Archangium minus TaxID=83450 RepID=A0ABY9X349_9BACT|nr:class I SAM-dependent methyltransferase [Archangium minus]
MGVPPSGKRFQAIANSMPKQCSLGDPSGEPCPGMTYMSRKPVITSKPMRTHHASRTAVKVGRMIVWLSRQPRLGPLVPQNILSSMERILLQVGELKPWMLRVYESPWYSRLITAIERRTIPGQALEIGLRKRFMDDETRAALARGSRQVLVVGAGLDMLCWRLAPEHPEITFVEVDHPATQALKREALDATGPRPSNLHLLGVDLARTTLEEALSGLPVWRAELPSVVIAEALLMYLEEKSVSAFLQAVHRCTGPGSLLLFTCIQNDEQGRLRLGKATRWMVEEGLRLAGEPFLWHIPERELRPFLARHGFRMDVTPERVDLHRRYVEPAGMPEVPVARYEFPVVADRE